MINSPFVLVCRIVLAVLGGLGLSVLSLGALLTSFENSSLDRGFLLSMALFLLFAASLSTGLMFWCTWHRPAQRSFLRVIVDTLAVCGMAVVCFFLMGLGSLIWMLVRFVQGQPFLPKP